MVVVDEYLLNINKAQVWNSLVESFDLQVAQQKHG